MARATLDTAKIFANARALGPDIEAAADWIAEHRRLPEDLLARLRESGVFRIAFPKAWGGPEMDMIAQCELMEILAYHDASVAWVAMICSDSGHYAARIDESVARDLYPRMDMLTSGALAPTGVAHRTPEGLKVSGRWQFGSGCLHADHLVGGCILFENGAPVMGARNFPEFRVVWLPRDKVEIHDTWRTTGLAGTSSNDYAVQDVIVPEAQSFHPFRVGARPEPLYRYHGFFFANLSGVAIGCARRMIDDLRKLAETKVVTPSMQLLKNEYRVQTALAEATAKLGAAKAYQDRCLSDLWSALEDGTPPTPAQRAGIGLMSVHAVQTAVQVSEIVCETAGSAAIFAASPFDRRRRDLLTMSAHVVAQRRTQQMMGQLLLGIDAPSYF